MHRNDAKELNVMLYKTRLSELAVPVTELGRLSLPTQVRPPTLHSIFCPGYIAKVREKTKLRQSSWNHNNLDTNDHILAT